MLRYIALIFAATILVACQIAIDETQGAVDQLPFRDPANPSSETAPHVTAPRSLLPYGEVARLCTTPHDLGQEVAQVAGFTLYDSAPGSTAFRTYYVTGFDDRCARQFSAALVTTGDASTYEFIRNLPTHTSRYSETDAAFEQVKNRFCQVRDAEPCGQRAAALDDVTAFITAYETFGSRPTWVEIFLHDGALHAVDFKTR